MAVNPSPDNDNKAVSCLSESSKLYSTYHLNPKPFKKFPGIKLTISIKPKNDPKKTYIKACSSFGPTNQNEEETNCKIMLLK